VVFYWTIQITCFGSVVQGLQDDGILTIGYEFQGNIVKIESKKDDKMLEFANSIEFSEEVKPKVEMKDESKELKIEIDKFQGKIVKIKPKEDDPIYAAKN